MVRLRTRPSVLLDARGEGCPRGRWSPGAFCQRILSRGILAFLESQWRAARGELPSNARYLPERDRSIRVSDGQDQRATSDTSPCSAESGIRRSPDLLRRPRSSDLAEGTT